MKPSATPKKRALAARFCWGRRGLLSTGKQNNKGYCYKIPLTFTNQSFLSQNSAKAARMNRHHP